MIKQIFCILTIGLMWAATAQAVGLNPAIEAQGLYYTRGTGGAGNVPSPYPQGVSGYTNRIGWETIEPSCSATAGHNPTSPTDACYSWTTFDSIMNAVPSNIKIAVGITTGIATPNWALNNYEADGFGTFPSVWNKPFTGAGQNTNTWGNRTAIPVGEIFEFPIPWDTNYETDVGNMAIALAAHIASSSYSNRVVRIEADVINSSTEENFLMGNQNQTSVTVGSGASCAGKICAGPCAGLAPGANCTLPNLDWQGTTGCNTLGTGLCGSSGAASWQTVGYTPTKVENAYKTMLASYVSAFPNVLINSDFVSGLMPPVNNSSVGGVQYSYPNGCTVNAGAQVDSCLVFQFINDGFSIAPYYAIQDNSGSNTPTTTSKFVLPFVHVGPIGMQTAAAISNNANYATMMNLYVGCTGTSPTACWNISYQEGYDADLTDSKNVAIDQWADTQMQCGLSAPLAGIR